MSSILWVRLDSFDSSSAENACEYTELIRCAQVVHTAAAAHALLRLFTYALIIVVAGDDPAEACRFAEQMRASHSKQRWIIISPHVDDAFERTARSLGALLVLERAITSDVLSLLLDELCETEDTRRDAAGAAKASQSLAAQGLGAAPGTDLTDAPT